MDKVLIKCQACSDDFPFSDRRTFDSLNDAIKHIMEYGDAHVVILEVPTKRIRLVED